MMRRYLLLLAVLLLLPGCRPNESKKPRISAVAALSASAGSEGFARAMAPRAFDFPADHGPHPDFETEWWYFTGNLEDQQGRRFGFQLTFFRRALAGQDEAGARESAWASRQLYLAHFTLTDVAGKKFHSFERFSRGALDLAGATAKPFRVALEDWQVASLGESLFPLQLKAKEGTIELQLELEDAQGWVAHGDEGLSRKGAGVGNASYYYSYPRLPAHGSIRIDGRTFEAKGEAWLDREWSTSVLAPEQVGWDWFSLQLEGGRSLMLFQLRRRDGSRDPFSAGTLIGADGRTEHLTADDFELEALASWQSPRSGARYPTAWRLRLPRQGIELETRALLDDQELDVSFNYWEGAIEATGLQGETPLRGRGYVEMVGYAEP